jgi:hypothetical protein
MSTREREPEQSIPLKYAPERALASAPEPSPGSDRPRGGSRPGGARPPGRRPPAAPRTREPAPPWKVAKPKGSLEGDVAIEEFRERMALAPDLPPPRCAMVAGGCSASSEDSPVASLWRRSPRMASSGFRHRTGQPTMASPTPATTRRPMSSRIGSPRPTAPASMPRARPMAASGRRFCGLRPCPRPLSMPTRCGLAMSRHR